MKTLSAFNQTAIDNPHVDIIRLVEIDFSGLILYLCDRTWGESGSKCIFNGQIYEPIILSWGVIDQGRINPITFKYSPGAASFTIDNKPPVGGFDCFTSIFNTYKPHKATVSISQIFNGASLAEDEETQWQGYIEDFPSMQQETVGMTCMGYDLSVLATFEHTIVSTTNYPGADPDEIGKMLPQVYGNAIKVPFIAVNVGSMTSLTEDLDISETIFDVTSTSAFPNSGTIQIDSEQMTYTGKTATRFTGCSRGANSTDAATHDSAATVAEIQSNYDFIIDHPVVAVPNVYVEHRTTGEFVRQDSSLYTIYTGQTGDEHTDYPGKAVIEFNLLPFITKQINIEDTIDVDDAIVVDDDIDLSVGGSSKEMIPTTGPANGRDGNSYTHTLVNAVVNFNLISFGFSSVNLGTIVSQTVYVEAMSVFSAPLTIRLGTVTLGTFHVLTQSTSRFTYYGGSWSDPIRLSCNLLDTGYNYVFNVYKVIEYNAVVSKSGSAFRTGAASKTGTVTLVGNSVADTVIGGLVCADVQGNPADDSGYYGTEGALIERPDYILKHILVDKCNLSINRIDTTSYDASGARYSTYFMKETVVLLEPPNIRDLAHDIARQCRSIVFWESGTHHLRYIEGEENTDKEIIANRIDLRTIRLSYTNRTYIRNSLNAVFNKEWTEANRTGVELYTDNIAVQDDDSIADYGALVAKQVEFPYIRARGDATISLNVLKVNWAYPKLLIELDGGLFLSDLEMGDMSSFSFTSDDILDRVLLKLVNPLLTQFRVMGKIQTSKSNMRLYLAFEPSSELITYDGVFYPSESTDDGYCIDPISFYNDRSEILLGETGEATTTSSTTSTASTTSSTASTASTMSTTSSSASTTSTTHTTASTSTSSTTSTTETQTTTTTINPCAEGYESDNRCTGMVAYASSQALGSEAPDAIDGDVEDYWKAAASGFPQWIEVEMLAPRTIGKIIIKTNAGQYTHHPTSFDLKASGSGLFEGEEVTLLSHTSVDWSSGETKEWWFDNDTAYKHWRLYHNGNAASEYATICELELYQCPSYSTTTTTTTSSSSTTASTASSSSTSSTASTVSTISTSSTAPTTTSHSTTSSSSSTASTSSTQSTTSSTASTISTSSTQSTTSSTASTISTSTQSTTSSTASTTSSTASTISTSTASTTSSTASTVSTTSSTASTTSSTHSTTTSTHSTTSSTASTQSTTSSTMSTTTVSTHSTTTTTAPGETTTTTTTFSSTTTSTTNPPFEETFEVSTGDGYDNSGWSETIAGGGDVDSDALSSAAGSPSGWGTECCKVSIVTGETAGSYTLSPSFSRGNKIYFRFETVLTSWTLPNSGDQVTIAYLASATYSVCATVDLINLSGTIYFRFNGYVPSLAGHNSSSISLNTRYRHEIEWDIDGNTYEYKLDGTSVGSGTNNSTIPFERLWLGNYSSHDSDEAFTCYYDRLKTGDDWIGA